MTWLPERLIDGPSAQIQLRALDAMNEMQQLVDLQRAIWGYGLPDTDFPYPARCLFALAESGGLVTAVFHDGRAVAFSVAWLGMERSSGKNYLHSQLVGVLPEYRHLGIGYHMKIYQRDFATQSGLDLVKWSFDPLQSANANLNLRKLGTVVRSYHSHYYGELQSYFSNGLAADRVCAEWYTLSPRVVARLDSPAPVWTEELSIPRVTSVESEPHAPELKRLRAYELNLPDTELLVEIPDDFEAIRRADLELAREWREKTREIFQHYLARGYILSDFVVLESSPRRAFYLLSRRPLEELLKSV